MHGGGGPLPPQCIFSGTRHAEGKGKSLIKFKEGRVSQRGELFSFFFCVFFVGGLGDLS